MDSTSPRPLAVVTGASSGIGYELAKQFGEHGYDLFIAAEDAAIERAAQDLGRTGAGVQFLQVDLARPEGVEALYGAIKDAGRPVEAIALNAGVGHGGDFARETDLDAELRVIDLNVRSTVHLAKPVITDMVARGSGRVLFTSSIASTQPGTFHAVYNASKSFVQSFAEAIRNELRDTGVTVTSLMPGPTDTEFFERAELEDSRIANSYRDDPAEVAAQGFEALMKGKEKVVAGSLRNKAQVAAGRLTPDAVKAQMHRKMAEPESA